MNELPVTQESPARTAGIPGSPESGRVSPQKDPVVGRFAPSPSRRMHLGNIYTAVAAWLCAKSASGQYLLRMEDLDAMRCPMEFADLILSDMEWLGLTWDNEEIPYQSGRAPIYEEYFRKLSEAGLLYPCFCSRAQLHVAEAPHTSDGRVIYQRTCRGLTAEEVEERRKSRSPATRLILPHERLSFTDLQYGPQEYVLDEDWGDIIIRRSDGVFAYQLAVTIDDGLMGVNQVVRGRDLLSSAAPQLYLFKLLGFRQPDYLHLPLLLAEDSSRLSKRDRAVDVGFLREQLPSPEPLIGYIGYLLGQLERPEALTLPELLSVFDRKKIPGDDIVIPGKYWENLSVQTP